MVGSGGGGGGGGGRVRRSRLIKSKSHLMVPFGAQQVGSQLGEVVEGPLSVQSVLRSNCQSSEKEMRFSPCPFTSCGYKCELCVL